MILRKIKLSNKQRISISINPKILVYPYLFDKQNFDLVGFFAIFNYITFYLSIVVCLSDLLSDRPTYKIYIEKVEGICIEKSVVYLN